MQTNAGSRDCDHSCQTDRFGHQLRSVAGGNWNDNNRQVNLNENHTDNQNNNARFRASAMVYVLYVDFSQPPSIFPISSILLCN